VFQVDGHSIMKLVESEKSFAAIGDELHQQDLFKMKLN